MAKAKGPDIHRALKTAGTANPTPEDLANAVAVAEQLAGVGSGVEEKPKDDGTPAKQG